MDDSMKSKLEDLRTDYKETTGEPFTNFFCPCLKRDEDVTLCKGHIINQGFRESSRAWTIQRKDIDAFYGSKFEADFINIQDDNKLDRGEFLINKTLFKKISPRVRINGEKVDYFVANGKIPKKFTKMEIELDGQSIQIGLKICPEKVLSSLEDDWQFDTSKDLRLSAIVSLIKAAHLTLFEILGYRYVLSASGDLIGRQILGEFFLRNQTQTRQRVLDNGNKYFHEFANMVRPAISDPHGWGLKGTIIDRMFMVCWGSSGSPWAIIIFIRIGQMLQSVMMPAFDHVDAVDTFLSFIRNDHESISVSLMHFKKWTGQWDLKPEHFQLQWPKNQGEILTIDK